MVRVPRLTRGGIVHAGPACKGIRVVLFFTIHKVTTPPYHPDFQVRPWNLPMLLSLFLLICRRVSCRLSMSMSM